MKYCVHCGKVMNDNDLFCAACGKRQEERRQGYFNREGLSEEELINKVNTWFAQNPYIGNVSGKFFLREGLGFLVNKYVLECFAVEYEFLFGENVYQYRIAEIGGFALYKKDVASLLADWKSRNPGAIVVNYNGGVHQRGSSSSLLFGGIGAHNKTQLYVLYKFNRKLGPGLPPPSNG